VKKSVWTELEENRKINSFRRELQRIYLHRLSELVLDKNKKIPLDAVSLARYNLIRIKSQIDALDKSNLDIITEAHLEETSAKIQSVLSVQLRKENL